MLPRSSSFRRYASLTTAVAVAVSLLPLSGLTTIEQVSADADLVAYWRLDEGSGTSAIDASGNGHTGTLTNVTYSATVPTVAFADPYSTYFNPASAGRIISTPLQLNGYSEFTMSGWAYPTAASSRASWFGQNDLFEFGFTDGDTLFCYTAKGEASWDFNPGTFLNNWHHITCLATSSQLIVYVDGVNVASAGISAGPFGSSGDYFSIGAGAVDGGTTGPFSGYIDDVRVYSRGLTPQEMSDLGSGEAGPGAAIVPDIELAVPADSSVINAWNPVVDWADAEECAYSWDEEAWTTVDCSQAGSEIDEPIDGSDITLFIRAKYDAEPDYATDQSTFTLDTVAPLVESGSNRTTNASFSLNEASASDENSGIDTYAWSKQSGSGSVTFSNNGILQPSVTAISQDGTYVLRLTVTDEAGNQAYDDMTVIWDTTNPSVTLDDFPDLITKQTSASFAFSGDDDLTTPLVFTCKLDGASFNSCTSPLNYSGLSAGVHSLTVRATDQASNSQETAVYSWTIDTTLPVISRTGPASVTLVQGQAYADAGATASDNLDGNLTSAIVVSNPVVVNQPGTYTVRYNVTDQAGNAAVEASRTVEVVSNVDLDDDGEADALQDSISKISETPTNKPVAIKTSGGCSVSEAQVTTLSELGSDASYLYPLGLVDFTIACVEPGETITVTHYYYDAPDEEFVLRKFQHGQVVMVPGASMARQTIQGQPVLVVSYELTDGGALDDDGQANGQIVDPAGPAVLAETGAEIPQTGAATGQWTWWGLGLLTAAVVVRVVDSRRQKAALVKGLPGRKLK